MSENLDGSQEPMMKSDAVINIVDAEKNQLIQIDHISGSWHDIPQTDELDSESISHFNHWFSSLPTAAMTVSGNSSHLMTCSFNYSQLVQAKDGSGALGAVLKPGTNKIGAQARFQEAENLQYIVNTSLIFNIASQILAQKHLADIDKRLHAIELKIDSILDFLAESRSSKIKSLYTHLTVVSRMLCNGDELTKDTLQNLAKSAQELYPELIHINKNISDVYNEIVSYDASSLFGSNTIRINLIKLIDKIECFQKEYITGMQCLLLANLILFIKHGGNKEFIIASEIYLKDINSDDGIIQKWTKTKQKIASHLGKMKPFFERTVSSQANALLVEHHLKRADNYFAADMAYIKQLNDQIQAVQSPQLIFEIVNGKIQKGIFKLNL